jgi:hypothetical protein
VHAESPYKDAAVRLNHIQGLGGQLTVHDTVALGQCDKGILTQGPRWSILYGTRIIEWQAVDDFASCGASPTPNALGRVDKNGFAHFLNNSGARRIGHIVRWSIPPVKSLSTRCAVKFIS